VKIARSALFGGMATILLLGGAIAYASFSSQTTGNVTVTKRTITITATQEVIITAAVLGGISCGIANGLTVTCPGTTITTTYTVDVNGSPAGSATAGTEALTIAVKNNGSATISPIVGDGTGGCLGCISAIIAIAAGAGNPTSISPGSTGIYTFTITALAAGSDSFLVSIAG
jgi:hypothetical protein